MHANGIQKHNHGLFILKVINLFLFLLIGEEKMWFVPYVPLQLIEQFSKFGQSSGHRNKHNFWRVEWWLTV